MRPVVVYLDSQDFSRFSPSHPDYEASLPIKQRLLALRDQGAARFVFSDVLFFEALPTEPKFIDQGLERIRTIAEMCGDDHLPSGSTIFEHEMDVLGGSSAVLDWTEWYPRFEMERPNIKAELDKWVIENSTNRKMRRALSKRISARVEPAFYKTYVDELMQKYPLLRGGRAAIEMFMRDNSTWPQLRRAILEGMRDIVQLSTWLSDNWKYNHNFSDGLRAGNRSTQESLINLYEKMRSTFNQSTIPTDDASKIVEKSYKSELRNAYQKIANKNATDRTSITPDLPIEEFFRAKAPSIFCAYTFIGELLLASALPQRPRNPHKKAGSDFADAMHLLFVPYVDIIRVDSFAHSVLKRANLGFPAQFAPSLTELPELIESTWQKMCESWPQQALEKEDERD